MVLPPRWQLIPLYNGDVHGVITSDNTGHITGSVTGTYKLTIDGQMTSPFVGQKATFNATISGDINGTITGGLICNNGYDSLYGVIIGTGATEPVRIEGGFVQSGITGDFLGSIVTGEPPAAVTSLSIQSGEATMAVGGSLQMTAATAPVGPYDVLWAVWVDDADKAWIDQAGVLHALKAGTVTVIANTLDPSLATATSVITIEEPETEVTAAIDPTYTIVIPAAVDFGTLLKNSGVETRPFNVTAQNVLLEEGGKIRIGVSSTFKMLSGARELAYLLYNHSAVVGDGGQFALFTGNDTESGSVKVDTALISNAGRYSGNMIFVIAYEN